MSNDKTPLSDQEVAEIEKRAEEIYWILPKESVYIDYDRYVSDRKELRNAYIAAATYERQRAKVLVEAFGWIKNVSDEMDIRMKAIDAITNYKQQP
jgi:hypothetical protein